MVIGSERVGDIYIHRHFIHSFKVEDTAYQLFHVLLCRAEMCIYFLKYKSIAFALKELSP